MTPFDALHYLFKLKFQCWNARYLFGRQQRVNELFVTHPNGRKLYLIRKLKAFSGLVAALYGFCEDFRLSKTKAIIFYESYTILYPNRTQDIFLKCFDASRSFRGHQDAPESISDSKILIAISIIKSGENIMRFKMAIRSNIWFCLGQISVATWKETSNIIFARDKNESLHVRHKNYVRNNAEIREFNAEKWNRKERKNDSSMLK